MPGLVARHHRTGAHSARRGQRARPVPNLSGSGGRKDSSRSTLSTVSRWFRYLRGTGPSSRTDIFYYHATELFAVRRGPWKLHLKTINPAAGEEKPKVHDPPLLFNLMHDPSERLNVAARHPDVIEQLLKDIEKHRQDVKPGKPQL